MLFFDKTELAEIVRENVSKAKLFDDYLSFLNYYKFAKLDISTALQKCKKQKFQKLDELKQKINNIDNTIKELEDNSIKEL